jgi:hypothetical protein
VTETPLPPPMHLQGGCEQTHGLPYQGNLGSDYATFSPCGRYRYELVRVFDTLIDDNPARGTIVWLMLNPSTANAFRNDPTVSRVMDRSMRLGYGAAVVLNLFALRATDPRQMLEADDPVGPSNREVCTWWAEGGYHTVAAWGTFVERMPRPAEGYVENLFPRLDCLGTTKAGHPRHPLYVSNREGLRPWR